MQKFITHNLYGMNQYGAAVTEVVPIGEPKAVYLASEVDARMARYEDLLRRAGIALATEPGPAHEAFVLKLYQDMHEFTSMLANEGMSRLFT